MRDFENWNNDPAGLAPKTAPPGVEVKFRADDRRRERRRFILAVAIVLLGAAVSLWALLRL
jgi:hypothetical protein